MTAIPGSIRVTGMIAPSDSTDVYATHASTYGKGGYKAVSNYTERDAITTERRSEGMLVYVIDTNEFFKLENNVFVITFGTSTTTITPGDVPSLPSLRMDEYNHSDFVKYLTPIHVKNKVTQFSIETYRTSNLTAHFNSGGIYSPIQGRIYFIPNGGCIYTYWYYIDCLKGDSLQSYIHGLTLSAYAYNGGVYSPNQNRIYLVPYAQNTQPTWHYIDCNTGSVVGYQHGMGTTGQYIGGTYSPKEDRIYFTPYNVTNTTWHYINCITGTVVPYTGVPNTTAYYEGSVYSPTQNRIYLVPVATYTNEWHYIDCDTGTVVSYPGFNSGSYVGGAYSPTENRIYFAPQHTSDKWHYIDCDTGNAVEHTVTALPLNAYKGAVYSPATNRIYLVPWFTNQLSATWHYIDCNTGNLVTYPLMAYSPPTAQGYVGGVYSPRSNRLYFIPDGNAASMYWHYIKEVVNAPISPVIAAYPMFNKL